MIDNNGNTSRSNEVTIPLRLQVFVPEVFTPNLDGMNDELEIKGRRIKTVNSYVFEIYNRWGERVYSSNDPAETWAGVDNNGNALPPSTYSYFLRLVRKDGETIQKKGSISLIR
ncbi:MAG: gliding motility-associated C-terminal domain-containing protein [Spirosomataceae bacterium]